MPRNLPNLIQSNCRRSFGFKVSAYDLTLLIILVVGGLFFHLSYKTPSPQDFIIGGYPYCDGYIWWGGAIHFSEGLVREIPGFGYFRAGYWALVGCLLAVIGVHYLLFQKCILIAFLATSAFFYLSIRSFLSKFGAAVGAALLVFNPEAAYWISLGMTDAVGFILNLLALSCLLIATKRHLSIKWVAAFGLFFSFSTLVRPFVSPYVGAVVLGVLFLKAYPLKKRLIAVLAIILAFWVPTLVYIKIQKNITGNSSISSNGSSAFYAASDPGIQTWAIGMDQQVESLAKMRLNKKNGDIIDLNKEYWFQAGENYKKYTQYHFGRFLPNLWKVAGFKSLQCKDTTALFQVIIITIFCLLLLSVQIKNNKCASLLLLLIIVGIILIAPEATNAMVFLGCLAAVFQAIKDKCNGGILIALFWLTGAFMMYLTGGIVGPPASDVYSFSYLGQRLVFQVSFAGVVMAVLFLDKLGQLIAERAVCYNIEKPPGNNNSYWYRFFYSPSPIAQKVVAFGFISLFLTIVIVIIAGGGIVYKRAHERYKKERRQKVIPFPDLTSTLEFLRNQSDQKVKEVPKIASDLALIPKYLENGGTDNSGDSGDVAVLGTGTSFAWSLLPQKRSLVVCYQEKFYDPVTMGEVLGRNSLFCNVQGIVKAEEWSKKQGLFILRNFKDKSNDLAVGQSPYNSPYFKAGPQIRAFVPIAPDGKSFVLDGIRKFTLVKYATQLLVSGELVCNAGSIGEPNYKWLEWKMVAGRRSIALNPDSLGRASLKIDTTRSVGKRNLSFFYYWNLANATQMSKMGNPSILVLSRNSSGAIIRELLNRTEVFEKAKLSQNSQFVECDLSDASVASIEITFLNVPVGGGIKIEELNLEADNFQN
jgi:hypothetical protein